jgi:hypothetical protein
MKPLTRIAAWVWIGEGAYGLIRAVYLHLHPVMIGRVRTGSAVWSVLTLVLEGIMLLCAVSLLRGRRWAWWFAVVLFGLAALGFPSQVARVLSGKLAAFPPWIPWTDLAWGVVGLFILVALLLDRPRPAQAPEKPDTGETPGPPTEEEPAP